MMKNHMRRCLSVVVAMVMMSSGQMARADLLGYWSGNSTEGQGQSIPNDQGNSDLEGELVDADYSGDGEGFTGQKGDYAFVFDGFDEDYGVLPATEETFDEITITAWVNGVQNGAWAGIVLARSTPPPIGLDYHAFDGMVNYIWNDNSAETWNFVSDLLIPEEEWTFVALTVTPDEATLYSGPLGEELEWVANEIDHFPQDNFGEWRLAEDDCCGTERNFAGMIDDVSIWNQALSADDLTKLHSVEKTPLTLFGGGLPGDYNNDGVLDAEDINLQSGAMKSADPDLATFDENDDGAVDEADRLIVLHDHFGTWMGDADLDGLFNSGDLVSVFTTGFYETGKMAGWAEGDWNGDMLFNSGDFVVAFSDGGYEKGPRPDAAAVPEPTVGVLAQLGLLGLLGCIRRGRRQAPDRG